jgi:hypothetical protein
MPKRNLDDSEAALEIHGGKGNRRDTLVNAHHHIVHEGLDSYEHPSVAEMT